ncbi:unnamed protein product, partial [Ectocarpus sp. 8 AP-2014]
APFAPDLVGAISVTRRGLANQLFRPGGLLFDRYRSAAFRNSGTGLQVNHPPPSSFRSSWREITRDVGPPLHSSNVGSGSPVRLLFSTATGLPQHSKPSATTRLIPVAPLRQKKERQREHSLH